MNLNLSNIANGAVDERFNLELVKVLKNIADLNTDPGKARKITLTVTFKGGTERNMAKVSVDAKTTLAPAIGIETVLLLDHDKNGPVANELKSGVPGQSFISEDGEVLDDIGKPVLVEKEDNNLINFK